MIQESFTSLNQGTGEMLHSEIIEFTSETRAKCVFNIIARKLNRTEQSSAINM